MGREVRCFNSVNDLSQASTSLAPLATSTGNHLRGMRRACELTDDASDMSLCAHVADSGPEPPANPIDRGPGTAAFNLNQSADAFCHSQRNDGECSYETSAHSGNFEHMKCMFNSLPTDLTDDERHRVIELLKHNVDVFARNSYDVGRTSLVQAEINTGNHAPISEPLRRHAKMHLDLIDKTVEDLQAAGLVEESTAHGHHGPPRVTLDLRHLNSITCRQTFAMPHVSESLDFLSQSKYLSVLDCTQSYFHVPLRECDKEKTAFLTRRGLFQWCVLPQGATNTPAIFSRLMSLVLRGLNYLCVLAFIDDLAVIVRSFDEHLLSLELVFNRLRYVGLKLKPSKCKLFQSEVKYLGFKVSGNSVSTDETKTACILQVYCSSPEIFLSFGVL